MEPMNLGTEPSLIPPSLPAPTDVRESALAGWWKRIAPILRRLRRHKPAMVGAAIFVVLVLTAIFAPLIAPYHPYEPDFSSPLHGPSPSHLLGTDEIGRDQLSRIIYGARLSLAVGLVSVTISLVIGVTLGAIAGYYGGWWDNVIMRLMDIILAFPAILLAIALMVMLGPGLTKAMIAIGIIYIPAYARIVRGAVLSVKQNEYVEAARAVGLPNFRIIMRHILPNIFAPILVRATLGTSEAILEAAALGFLGLGAQLPQPEWGAMLAYGRRAFYSAPHLVLFPGIAISITVLALNLLGDGLRDALDPRLKQ